MRAVLQVLILGVGVDRRHQALDDAELVVEHLGQRAEAVRGARRVGDDVLAAVVLVVVDADDDGDVRVGGRRGDDDLLRARIQVPLGLGGVGEDARGLDDDVDAEIAPWQFGRTGLDLERLDLGVADDDDVVALEADVVGQSAEDGVELQQMRECRVVREVVDRDDLDVGVVAERLLRVQGPEEVASDSAEAVDAYPNRHCHRSLMLIDYLGQPSSARLTSRRLV